MSITKRALLAQSQLAHAAGLQVDYENNRFTRLAGARGRAAGTDFDCFAPFGGRRRCCVANDGAVNAFYGEAGYAEDGSNGQVMVYQPRFYYRVEPLLLAPSATGVGSILKKANYFVSSLPLPGFRLHPAFYGRNGTPVDHILLSAYEASYYDASLGGYFTDGTDTDRTIDNAADRLCSLAGKKPISGLTKPLTADTAEELAKARGAGWHVDTVKTCAANQLLMIIEYGCMSLQEALGYGLSSIPDTSGVNCSSLTGSTASLGNASGMAAGTVNEKRGAVTSYTENGRVAISYRGLENPWGNIWKMLAGINVYGDGASAGGAVYIAGDLSFQMGKRDGNYAAAGITLPNATGNIGAMAYGASAYDWLFIPAQTNGSNPTPVGDYMTVSPNLNGYRLPIFGGRWSYGNLNGEFCMGASNRMDYCGAGLGCRLVCFPA